MPLVRFQIRNEYALGTAELYGAEEKKDDPNAILDGLAVAGLVGVLRQLGDLAEFAAEVFHDLQEQVMATASRSHKLIVRVHHVEATLTPIENVIFSQTNHIHFAYTRGSDWHPSRLTKKNHIVNSDLPPFIMDSYEECRDPPSLHQLDKFDSGGPGVCLKRYSDPSFFKRSLTNSDLVNTEKLRVEKKARQHKETGGHQRIVRVPHAVEIPQKISRMQFSSSNISQKDSMTRSISNLRSGLEDRSTSFDSSKSDYIDCTFETSTCMPCKEQEEHILTTSRLRTPCNDAVGSSHPCELNVNSDDLFPQKDQRVANESSVTWEEKTEILKSTSQKSSNDVEDQMEISDLRPVIFDQNKLETEAASLDIAKSDAIMSYNEDMLVSPSDGKFSQEEESEPEYYMDALNTTASEIDTDAEKQSRMVEIPCENLKNHTDSEIRMLNQMTFQSDSLFSAESCVKLRSQDPPKFLDDADANIPDQIISMYSKSNGDVGTDSSEVIQSRNIPREDSYETSTSDCKSSGFNDLDSQTSLSEKIISSVCNPQGSFRESSAQSPIQLWTNGGLLGVEPSKPADFRGLDSPSQKSALITDDHDLSSDKIMPGTHLVGSTRKLDKKIMTSETTKNPRSKEEPSRLPNTVILNDVSPHQLVRNIESVQEIDSCAYYTSGQDRKENLMLRESTSSKFMLNKSDEDLCSSNVNARGHFYVDTREMNHGCELPIVPGISGSSTELSQETKASSSSMFLPSYRLLASTFQKKVSVSHSDMPEPSCTVKTALNEHLKHGSPTNSASSSPPLERMRISFYPIDGSETSILKLKFHDEHHFHDKNKEIVFPSFQLLPQPVIPQNNINSDSDDDTFSVSSEYMSDKLMSELSESNSDQWECGKTSGPDGNEIYDTLRRVSSDQSISLSSEIEEIEGITHNGIYSNGDFQCYDATNGQPLHAGYLINLLNEKKLPQELQSAEEPMPPPPPLPPLQWRVVKPHIDRVEDIEECISEAFTNQKSQQGLVSIKSQQPDRSLMQQVDITETTTCPSESKQQNQSNGHGVANQSENSKKMDREEDFLHQIRSKKQEQYKLNGHLVTMQSKNMKNTDEKEDFLHQIRSKSFNLKRTETAKPVFTPGPVTDMKVAAILQKANAIRQAFVGSDEEDSENWSDG